MPSQVVDTALHMALFFSRLLSTIPDTVAPVIELRVTPSSQMFPARRVYFPFEQ